MPRMLCRGPVGPICFSISSSIAWAATESAWSLRLTTKLKPVDALRYE